MIGHSYARVNLTLMSAELLLHRHTDACRPQHSPHVPMLSVCYWPRANTSISEQQSSQSRYTHWRTGHLSMQIWASVVSYRNLSLVL